VLDANGRSLDEEPAQRRVAELSGRGAVPGTVQGRVKILSRPEDARGVEVGCVLVLASADIGSTLLFPQAGAMVVERGGLLSHAIVLAREFGLPAVIGVTGRDRQASRARRKSGSQRQAVLFGGDADAAHRDLS
jgi:phosphohistidine swiveling domain-containing protein